MLKLFRVIYRVDGNEQEKFVEATGFDLALHAWRVFMTEEYGFDAPQPDAVVMVAEGEVLRGA